MPSTELKACLKFSGEHFILPMRVKAAHGFHHHEKEALSQPWTLDGEFNSLACIFKSKGFFCWVSVDDSQPTRDGCLLIFSLPPGPLCKEIKEGICALLSLSSPSTCHVHTGHVGTVCTCPHANTAWYKSVPSAASSKCLQLHSLLTSFLWTITMEIP